MRARGCFPVSLYACAEKIDLPAHTSTSPPCARGSDGDLDVVDAQAQRAWTSESFFLQDEAKRAGKAAEAEARKEKKAAAAAAAAERAAEAARRSEAAAKKRSEAAAAKAAKEADRAARVAQKKAARAARQMPQQPLPQQPPQQAVEGEDSYARQYNKRARVA